MLKISAAFAALAVCLTATTAAAQARLPEVMQGAAEARSGVFDGREKSPWALEQYGDVDGKGCTLYHFAGSEMLAIVGPNAKGIMTDDPNESVIILSGPKVPLPKGGPFQHQLVTVRLDGKPVLTIKAVLVPNMTGDTKSGGVLLYSKSLEEGLIMVRDTQTLGIDIDGTSVFSTSWTGATKQVTKLRACVAGNPV